MAKYHVNLYYGYQEHECGIFHAFEAVDAEAIVDEENMRNKLANALDLDADDERFNYNSMYVELPESLVERIRTDALNKYLSSCE